MGVFAPEIDFFLSILTIFSYFKIVLLNLSLFSKWITDISFIKVLIKISLSSEVIFISIFLILPVEIFCTNSFEFELYICISVSSAFPEVEI